ncbi:MAG: NAD-dependent epimerase/dehydratase family protein [Pseudomonadota bacterium]
MTGPRVLVLGGNGFIGRHAVAALRAMNVSVSVGSRLACAEAHTISTAFQSRLTARAWQPIVEEYDAILNCVGILRPKGAATYDRVHHLAPTALARACKGAGRRYVHVSALGLSDSARSRFLTTKLAGERAIQDVGGDWIIARPSLLDGDGGYGAKWLRGVARLPVFVAPADARGAIAALTAEDLGVALARLSTASAEDLRLDQSRCFELGGETTYVFADYIRGLRRRTNTRPALCITVPGWSARVGAHLCDLFNATPFSFGHWELLRRDNAPHPNRLPELLRRAPTPVIPPDAVT